MSERYQRIRVSIAGRVYPLNVKLSEEEKIRNAVAKIEEAIKKLESNYSVQDKQDLLAMYALQLATKLEKIEKETVRIDEKVGADLLELEKLIDSALER
jgi:cell division protein ZapA